MSSRDHTGKSRDHTVEILTEKLSDEFGRILTAKSDLLTGVDGFQRQVRPDQTHEARPEHLPAQQTQNRQEAHVRSGPPAPRYGQMGECLFTQCLFIHWSSTKLSQR